MKLNALPLLEGGSPETFEVEDLQPRRFINLLDQHKALIFQSSVSDAPFFPDDFGDFLVSLQLEYYPYIGGAAP